MLLSRHIALNCENVCRDPQMVVAKRFSIHSFTILYFKEKERFSNSKQFFVCTYWSINLIVVAWINQIHTLNAFDLRKELHTCYFKSIKKVDVAATFFQCFKYFLNFQFLLYLRKSAGATTIDRKWYEMNIFLLLFLLYDCGDTWFESKINPQFFTPYIHTLFHSIVFFGYGKLDNFCMFCIMHSMELFIIIFLCMKSSFRCFLFYLAFFFSFNWI
jgi:hypothetical protein